MSMRILAVDDSRMMREMLLMALRGAGFDVIQAEDGEHGMEVLAANGADVIITDINMPKLDGFGFIERGPEIASDDQLCVRYIPVKRLERLQSQFEAALFILIPAQQQG